MKYLSLARLLMPFVFVGLASLSHATPELSLEVIAEREVVVETEDGDTRTDRIQVSQTSPGQELFYTIRYQNTGTSAARNVNLDNPIPDGSRYVANSAWGEAQDILFAVNEEGPFKRPAALNYRDAEGDERRANPEEYSIIRWVIDEVPAGAQGEVGFTVVVD